MPSLDEIGHVILEIFKFHNVFSLFREHKKAELMLNQQIEMFLTLFLMRNYVFLCRFYKFTQI